MEEDKVETNDNRDLEARVMSHFHEESRRNVTFAFEAHDLQIMAHKNILTQVSPVFKSMFFGTQIGDVRVKINDIRPEIFQLLLDGIYADKIPFQSGDFSDVTCTELYYAAQKYEIKDLCDLVKSFIIDSCRSGNTHFLLENAKKFKLPDLELKCKNYFKKFSYLVLSKHMDLTVNDAFMYEFFALEGLSMRCEYELYVALEVLVENKLLPDCSKCLKEIRFLTMDINDIFQCTLLTHAERCAVATNNEAKMRHKDSPIPMPDHVSTSIQNRTFSEFISYERQYFWTCVMLKSFRYEKYFDQFMKYMKISPDWKDFTEYLIVKSRKEIRARGADEVEVIANTTNNIFPLNN